MKFLKESDYEIKDEVLKIVGKCKQFNTSEQAHMLSLITTTDFNDRLELSRYALGNFVSELSVDGNAVDVERFKEFADLSDDSTLKTYLAVGELCSVANRLNDEEVKK